MGIPGIGGGMGRPGGEDTRRIGSDEQHAAFARCGSELPTLFLSCRRVPETRPDRYENHVRHLFIEAQGVDNQEGKTAPRSVKAAAGIKNFS